jgi:hypothetical protein
MRSLIERFISDSESTKIIILAQQKESIHGVAAKSGCIAETHPVPLRQLSHHFASLKVNT